MHGDAEAVDGALRALLIAVIASPTQVAGDPSVAAAIDAAIITRQQLRGTLLAGHTVETQRQHLIKFWTDWRPA